MTRLWLSAVVCSLSIASVAVPTAVSKPKRGWVPLTSLSMVLGTPTTGRPLRQRSWEIWRLPSPPMRPSASNPLPGSGHQIVRAVDLVLAPLVVLHDIAKGLPRLVVPRMVPPRWVMPRTSGRTEGTTPLKVSRPS